MTKEQISAQAKEMLRTHTTEELVNIYEANNKKATKENWKTTSQLREWLLDILEEINEKAFWKWIDESEEESPRKFYLTV